MSPHESLERWLPLTITGVAVNDPAASMFGDGWSLGLLCAWNLSGPGIDVSSETGDYEDALWDLVGGAIESVSVGEDLVDPVFHLSGGVELVISAGDGWDPWWLTLPDIVLVGKAQAQA